MEQHLLHLRDQQHRKMTRLSVNINKIATLRNARGGNLPDVEKAAVDIQGFGAVDLVLEVVPEQVTLVPDAHDAITSNAGWNTLKHKDFLTDICRRFREKGIRTSIFIDPDPDMAEGAAACGADRVELYTADYAAEYVLDPDVAVARYLETAKAARSCGLGVNAGHDLNLDNLGFFIRTIPWTAEVSIGHALISDALYLGLEQTIRAYLGEIRKK